MKRKAGAFSKCWGQWRVSHFNFNFQLQFNCWLQSTALKSKHHLASPFSSDLLWIRALPISPYINHSHSIYNFISVKERERGVKSFDALHWSSLNQPKSKLLLLMLSMASSLLCICCFGLSREATTELAAASKVEEFVSPESNSHQTHPCCGGNPVSWFIGSIVFFSFCKLFDIVHAVRLTSVKPIDPEPLLELFDVARCGTKMIYTVAICIPPA